MKKIAFFALSAGLSLAAAGHRWGDSAHSMGLIGTGGGKSRHPAHLGSGRSRYTLITTATVMPPYRGDARVVLEGEPRLDYEIHLSAPAVDLGVRRKPELREDILHDLRPFDRIALWIVMRPPAGGPDGGGKGRYALALYDTKTGEPVLRIPVLFGAKREAGNAGGEGG